MPAQDSSYQTPVPVPGEPPVAKAPPAPGAVSTPETPPPPKKGFPKIALILVVVLGLVVVGFLLFKFVLPLIRGEQEVTLTWWGLWEDQTIVAPLITEYEGTHPKVKITYVKQSHQDYRERLTSALATETGPDIFRFHNSWVPMFKNELDKMPASVMTAAEYAEIYYPVVSSDLASGTGLVGIPLGYDALTMYINEDIFASAGKALPTTWDDLRQTAIELTIKDDRGIITQAGVSLGKTENVDHWPEILALMMLQNGANLSKPTNKLAEDALVFYTVFASADGVWDETLPPSTVAFAGGKVAIYFGPSWRAFEIKQQNPDLNFRTYSLPQLPKASSSQSDVSYATYWVEGVWTRSQEKEAAWEFLKFLSSRSSLEKMYQNAAQTRTFGEPYPRTEMQELLVTDPIVGSIISQAPDAQSWFLQSRTFDGPTGINSQINKYYEDAINAVNSGVRADRALETVASGVSQILSQYGLVSQ
jgi:ABC-type glycerol-3-phosphate transport system substrate-binding protein